MNRPLISSWIVGLVALVFILPVAVMMSMAWLSSSGPGACGFSTEGVREILSTLRLNELMVITARALAVAIAATAIGFLIAYLLFRSGTDRFQTFFLTLMTLPFLANEAVRVFSWQYILSENGAINTLLSWVSGSQVLLFNSTNSANVVVVMILNCIPFGVFISIASLKTVPAIYWRVCDDLNLSAKSKFLKIALPLSRVALYASFVVTFFIAFSLSSEVNFLGGDSKVSLRNLVLSLMSASKFQSIFTLGGLMTIVIVVLIVAFRRVRNDRIISV